MSLTTVAFMAHYPEVYCVRPGCGHVAAVHETTDDEPGPCWHTTEDPPCPCDAFVRPASYTEWREDRPR